MAMWRRVASLSPLIRSSSSCKLAFLNQVLTSPASLLPQVYRLACLFSARRAMILNTIKEGKIVPSEVTVKLIQKEMESIDNHKFLIDGFPRNEENRKAFEKIIRADPDVVLFFDCPEEEMVKRVLNRNEGRVDDNKETVKKRLEVFYASHLPVINYYSQKGKLYKIEAVGTEDEIFERVRPVFAAFEV
ncbi:hypothetical protein CDL15_Pgr022878 [Punica granatum]|uniref:adenylate kinase n=1 Tax=Punica granatum TaxID=22663 RepID=A0A218X465_PUNGR|nr:hypothetical protein CDL15_Pgr022878 [Punica granatum]